jgi:hypothetical protein
MLQFTDATIINDYLERTFGVTESLSSWWNGENHSVQFMHFWLSDIKEEARVGLMHLEASIIKDQLALAFAVGMESGDLSEDEITSFLKAILREYPRRLCTDKNARYKFLDILFVVCSPEKDHAYKELLTDVCCSTSNKQYSHWLLASRAFALISLCDAVVRFFCEATPSIPMRPKTAEGRRLSDFTVLLSSPSARTSTPSDQHGHPKHYIESGNSKVRKRPESVRTLDRNTVSPHQPTSCLSTGLKTLSPSNGHKNPIVTDRQRAFQAVQIGSLKTLQYLLDRKRVDVSSTDDQNRTLLTVSLVHSQSHVLTFLLTISNGPSVNLPGMSGNTPLHIAVRQGSVEMVQDLILAGAHVNCWNAEADGATPLHLAVMHDHVEVVECLLSAGADSTANMGIPATITPLTLARDLGHTEIVKVLETAATKGNTL